jgi:hypothetical protein
MKKKQTGPKSGPPGATKKKRALTPPPQKPSAKPGTPGRLSWFLGAGAGLLLFLDLFMDKDPYFPWEGYPAFLGALAFVSSALLILGAKYLLRFLVKRPEDYYDR